MTRRADAVVVGSGPGGAVTARALAEAGLDVLVLEEGSWTDPVDVVPYSPEQMRRQYRGAGLTAALGAPSIAYTEARCVGGGSEVNSGLYHRPPAAVLEQWRTDLRIEDLTPASLEAWHRVVERELHVAPWPDGVPPSAAATALLRGAAARGWPATDVPRWATYESVDGRPVPRKQTMGRTYLPRARDAGAELWSGARVRLVRLRPGRSHEVELERDGHRELVTADHVFVCAGAIQTPALLQRSGVHRNVGGNLSVHPTVKVVAELDDAVDPDDVASVQVRVAEWLTLGGSASRRELVALALAESWETHAAALEAWPRVGVFYAAIRSHGRGRVRAVPGMRDPVVTYRLTAADRRRLASGMDRLVHLLRGSGARRLYPSYRGAPVVVDDATALAANASFDARTAPVMTVHLTGTTPMGEDLRRAATDSFGRVHGHDRLHVNDAGLLPSAPGVNPQGTLMAVAHRNVAHVLASLGAHGVGA